MRILVTGSNGLIGSEIAVHLARQGHEVFGLNRTASPESQCVALRTVQADIAAPGFLDQVLATMPPCEAIVHAAASLSMRNDDPAVSLTNCLGTQQIVALANRWAARSLVYFSSVAVIGRPRYIPIDEEHPTGPLTVYGASKLFGEHVAALASMPAAMLRVTAPIGPRMPSGRIVPIFLSRARAGEPVVLNGKGSRRQNYVDVRDIAQAVEACIVRGASGVYCIGGAESVSNYELAKRCIRVVGSESGIAFSGRPDPDDEVAWEISLEKAARDLGYRPRYALNDSIKDIADEG